MMNCRKEKYSEPKPGMKVRLIRNVSYSGNNGGPTLKKGQIFTLKRPNHYNKNSWLIREGGFSFIGVEDFEII